MILVLLAGMLPAVAGTSYAIWIPRTIQQVLRSGWQTAGSSVLQRSLPFEPTEIGITWKGDDPPPRIRTSRDGAAWGRWQTVTEWDDMFDRATGTRYSNLLAGAGARWVQLQPAQGLVPGALSVALINTRDGPLRAIQLTRTASAAGQPVIISRRAWGADESIRKGTPSFTSVRKIFIHHTVTPNNADPASTIRSIYAYHVQIRGWDDIGYNFLVDSRGNTYEGRYSRAYGPGESPTGEDSSGRGVVGAHTENYNEGSTGIALLGDAESQAPPGPAVDALVNLIAWKAERNKIDPTGSDSFPNVAGHNQAPGASTECPGAKLEAMLPSMRERAKQMIGAAPAGGGPLSGIVGPILNGPAGGLGDAVSGLLRGIGL